MLFPPDRYRGADSTHLTTDLHTPADEDQFLDALLHVLGQGALRKRRPRNGTDGKPAPRQVKGRRRR